MHASANCRADGSHASVLFGLSGTGKTTLSADPERALVGDDEIVWTDDGLWNLEGGCYAKLIDLDADKEPEIFRAISKPGAILENVSMDEAGRINFADRAKTENTRGSYPLSSLKSIYRQDRGAQAPRTIVFLTADAFGALPAVARLDSHQAQYHFISGYTAKVAGTEMGVKEPKAAFSTCFGAPFMPRPSAVYAKLLAERARASGASVWLLNTGWTGGGYGKGPRFPIPVTRALLRAIQSGELEGGSFVKHPVFGFEVPTRVPGVEASYLALPEGDGAAKLARLFAENIAKNHPELSGHEIVAKGGPRI